MVRPRKLKIAAVFIALGVAAPSSTLAATGGVGLPATAPSATAAAVANQPVTVSGEGITVSSHAGVLLHGRLWLKGTVSTAQPGRNVVIEQQRQPGSQWTQAGSATIGPGGSFVAAWRPQQVGRFSVAVALQGSARVSPSIEVISYRPSIATLFGPGLYGNHTACGALLRKPTLGVANRKLPCGTQVAVYYRGRTVVVPVIDRGPYANNANWDLTMATGRALGMNSTSTVGALSLAAIR
jgi:rare lipoprotein A